MAASYDNFVNGLGIVSKSSTTNNTPGDIEYLSSDGKLHIYGASSNDAVVMEALAATLTNKSISGGTNTLTNIANTSLTNSSVTINGTSVSLGGSITVTATATSALTIGTGLTGTSYNGSTPITIAIDTAIVATTTNTITLTNKTLTSPTINTINSPASTNLILNAPTGQSITGQINGSTISTVSATGLILASTKTLTLTNNSQTVSLSASSTASASYTITTPDAAPSANTALVYNGTNYVWATAGGWTTATSTSLAAAGTITISTTAGQQFFIVAGASTAVTLSTTPFGSSPPGDGATIRLVCNDNTKTVTITNNDITNGTVVNGNATLYKYNMIEFQYSSSLQRYIEMSRNFG